MSRIGKQLSRATVVITREFSQRSQSMKKSVDQASVFLWGVSKAAITIMFFSIVICVIYLQQQPYRYTKSHAALEKFLDMAEVNDLQGVEAIRKWYEGLVYRIPRTAMRDIEANCGYTVFAEQDVSIDSQMYTLQDPRTQYSSCGTNTQFVGGYEHGFYINGNLQMMGIGIFSARSTSRFPSYVDSSQQTAEAVVGNQPTTLRPAKDSKVVEVCIAPWGEECVKVDAFRGEWGSSFQWEGVKTEGVRAFHENSSVTIVSGKPATTSELHPCFIHGDDQTDVKAYDSSYTVAHTKESLVDCKNVWVVKAREVRNTCQEDLYAPSALMAFRAAKENRATVVDLYNATFLCSLLQEKSALELQSVFFSSSFPLASQMDRGVPYYGTVVTAPNEHMFAALSWEHVTKLNFYRVFDGNTRMVRVFTILRNYGSREMFYGLVSLTFNIDSSGYTTAKLEVAFVPMVKYFYALDGNRWLFKEVLVLEILLGLVSFLFILLTVRNTWNFLWAYCGARKGRSIRRLNRAARRGDTDKPASWKKSVEVAPIPQSDDAVEVVPGSASGNTFEHHPAEGGGDVEAGSGPQSGDREGSEETSGERGSGGSGGGGGESEGEGGEEGAAPGDMGKKDGVTELSGRKEDSLAVASPASALTEISRRQNDGVFRPSVATDRNAVFALLLDIATVIMLIMFLVARVNFVQACIRIADMLTDGSEVKFNNMESVYIDINDTSADVTSVAYALLVVAICQFFRYMSFDPRMGIVVDTIHDSLEFLVPILVIFIGVLIAFAVLGSHMFGARHFGWSTIGRSTLSLMMMILGDHAQFHTVYAHSQAAASVFFWGFIVILFFVTFNMVLAVVLTVYDEKHKSIKEKSAASKKID